MHVPPVYLQKLYTFIIDSYEQFFSTKDFGHAIFNAALNQMDPSQLLRLQTNIYNTLPTLSMSREKSFCLQNFVK